MIVPGRTLITPRAYGSRVEAENPKALVAPSYIRGSGTSQAAAVTSGAAALLLASRPTLTPDQVKALLTSTASPIPNHGRNTQGSGRLQLETAMSAPTPSGVQEVTASGLGSLDASRGGMRVTAGCGGVPTEIRGEMDVRCQPWDGKRWTSARWTGDAWTGSAWKGSEWTGSAWKGVSWSEAVWTGSAWKGGTWLGASWYGTSGWNGDATTTSAWTGSAWKASTWQGSAWKDTGWTTGEWTGAQYDEFLTAFWGSTPPAGKQVKGEPYTKADDGKDGKKP